MILCMVLSQFTHNSPTTSRNDKLVTQVHMILYMVLSQFSYNSEIIISNEMK